MTRYSRSDAEQLIGDAQGVIEQVKVSARMLETLRREQDAYGSQAAMVHARIDEHLTWFTDRMVRLDRLEPVALAFPGRLMLDDDAVDVWLSWQQGEDGIGWFYGLNETFVVRRSLPAGALV